MQAACKVTLRRILGIFIFLLVWWLAFEIMRANENLTAFSGFAPWQTAQLLKQMLVSGEIERALWPSLQRVFSGIFWAASVGIPIGLLYGYSLSVRQMAEIPFQFLRMISPLAWMPVAVILFATWDEAIVFLIVMATIWPILLGTAGGVMKINPDWLRLARVLGGNDWQILTKVIFPAVLPDVIAGLRLAIGVAWIVIVPAEYLGVTSGLGYAINDARDTIDYGRLAALVLIIGFIGYLLDKSFATLLRWVSWHQAERGYQIGLLAFLANSLWSALLRYYHSRSTYLGVPKDKIDFEI